MSQDMTGGEPFAGGVMVLVYAVFALSGMVIGVGIGLALGRWLI